MATKAEHMQTVWHRYGREHEHEPTTTREVVEWGVREGILALPRIDPHDVLASEMARALREEYATDAQGRRYRVNHAMRITRSGIQLTFWAVMGFAPHSHMQVAFTQRREQIVGDCLQLKIDVDAYNDMNKHEEPIQLVLDFTDDIAERLARDDDRMAA